MQVSSGASTSTHRALAPKTALTAHGRQLVTWLQATGDAGRDELWGRVVEADGRSMGQEFQISRAAAQGLPVTVGESMVAARGRRDEFLVVWTQRIGNSAYRHLAARRLDGSGRPLSDEFAVASPDRFSRLGGPKLAYGARRREFLIVWRALDATRGSEAAEVGDEIYGTRLPAGSSQTPPDFRLSSMGSGPNDQVGAVTPAVAYNSRRGDYLVAWEGGDESLNQNGIKQDAVFARTLPAAPRGRLGRTRRVSGFDSPPSVLLFPDVAFNRQTREYLTTWATPWSSRSRVYARRIHPDGRPYGGEAYVAGARPLASAALPDVEPAPDGHYEFVFTGALDPDEDHDAAIYTRRLGPKLKRGRLRTVTSRGEGALATWPAITYSTAQARFRAVWLEEVERPYNYEVFTRGL
jgi:hypothetical protein